jgi:hypothetical protein
METGDEALFTYSVLSRVHSGWDNKLIPALQTTPILPAALPDRGTQQLSV